MPTSTNIAKYPEGMLDVIEAVCETGKSCDIAYPSQRIAKAERLRFYGLIRALHITGHSLGPKATRLELKQFGADAKEKNIIRIGFPSNTANNEFYKTVADRHMNPEEPQA